MCMICVKLCLLCFSLSYLNLSLHLYTKISNRVGFNLINIIFGGTPFYCKTWLYILLLILCCKRCTFSCVLQSRTPKFCGLLYHFRIKYYIERYVVIHDSKLSIFYNNRSLWKTIFEQNNSQLIICYTLYLFRIKSRTCKHSFYIFHLPV